MKSFRCYFIGIAALLFVTDVAYCQQQQLNFSGLTGVIYSPNYPNNYDNSENVEYTISVEPGHYIHLTLLDFSTEDPYDYVNVINGPNETGEIVSLKNFTGNQTGETIDVMYSEATLIFKTDLTTTYRGFAIQFDSVEFGSKYLPTNSCPSPLHNQQFGIVTSPNFPDNYPNNITCSYFLIAPEGHVINLQFVGMNTEDGYDIVYVYDGSNITYPLIGEYSGNKLPPIISSTSTTMYLVFKTDLVNNFSGFSALYTSKFTNNIFHHGILPKIINDDEVKIREKSVKII